MKILGIETSCDETAIAIVEAKGKAKPNFKILENIVSSQVKIHAKWGGVVPNLAKREHERNLTLVLKRALKNAKLLKRPEKLIVLGRQSDNQHSADSYAAKHWPSEIEELI